MAMIRRTSWAVELGETLHLHQTAGLEDIEGEAGSISQFYSWVLGERFRSSGGHGDDAGASVLP